MASRKVQHKLPHYRIMEKVKKSEKTWLRDAVGRTTTVATITITGTWVVGTLVIVLLDGFGYVNLPESTLKNLIWSIPPVTVLGMWRGWQSFVRRM